MIVYHGSVTEVREPDVLHSFRELDFGKGFYVTTVQRQAERWALRRADLFGPAKAIVNEYVMLENTDAFSVLTFGSDLNAWLDFVCKCRDGEPDYQQYDLICGKVADDRVYRVVELYKDGIWDRDRALKEIRAYEDYDQTAFISQRAIDALLRFQRSWEVEPLV